MTADLQNPAFNDDEKAREALEAVRWPDGPICPHCGCCEPAQIALGRGKAHRPGHIAGCSALAEKIKQGQPGIRVKILPLAQFLEALDHARAVGVSCHGLFR